MLSIEERSQGFDTEYEALKKKWGIAIVPTVADNELVQTKHGPKLETVLGLTVVALADWKEPEADGVGTRKPD